MTKTTATAMEKKENSIEFDWKCNQNAHARQLGLARCFFLQIVYHNKIVSTFVAINKQRKARNRFAPAAAAAAAAKMSRSSEKKSQDGDERRRPNDQSNRSPAN